MGTYFNIHNHTMYSNIRLLDCINRPKDLIDKAIELGLSGIAITDHECLSAHMEVNQFMKNYSKEHPDFTNYNQRLIHLEGTIFDQGVEGHEGFIPGLQTVVGTLNIQMQEVVQEINDIYERLTWQEMDEDVSEYLFDDNNENITMATTTVGTF